MATVSAALKRELLALTKQELTVPFLVSKISKTTKNTRDANGKRSFDITPAPWNCQDRMRLKAGEYINTVDVDTTLGSFLVNKLIIEDNLNDVIPGGYYNDVITKKNFDKLINLVSMALMEKKIPIDPNVVRFLQAFEFYGLMLCAAISPSMTP